MLLDRGFGRSPQRLDIAHNVLSRPLEHLYDETLRLLVENGRQLKEGNGVVIRLVDPIRRITSRFPWRVTKYCVAAPLAYIFFVYVKLLMKLIPNSIQKVVPLFEYCRWISVRKLDFFHHVVFDQLVTPRTVYLDRKTIERWLVSNDRIVNESIYILMRNGNSWKFGGLVR